LFTALCLAYYLSNGFEFARSPDSEETIQMPGVSKPLPPIPQSPEANASGTGPGDSGETRSGVVPKPSPPVSQTAVSKVSAMQPDDAVGTKAPEQEQKAEVQKPGN
jgi:hypothetical protein